MYGCCCGVGAFGAVLGLTIGSLIHNSFSPQTLYILEILLCIAYIILYYSLGGTKQFVDRWNNEKYKHSGIEPRVDHTASII